MEPQTCLGAVRVFGFLRPRAIPSLMTKKSPVGRYYQGLGTLSLDLCSEQSKCINHKEEEEVSFPYIPTSIALPCSSTRLSSSLISSIVPLLQISTAVSMPGRTTLTTCMSPSQSMQRDSGLLPRSRQVSVPKGSSCMPHHPSSTPRHRRGESRFGATIW